MHAIAEKLNVPVAKLANIRTVSMVDYQCPFERPPVVWICNPNLGATNGQTATQMLTYPSGTDVYTEDELFSAGAVLCEATGRAVVA